jgi:hypothetical protein
MAKKNPDLRSVFACKGPDFDVPFNDPSSRPFAGRHYFFGAPQYRKNKPV